ncbi:MAG: response regulator transcription factor [Gemmatimonadota bacterium]|nr:response regulator transcription factor [Gemmatimonadota bacterium]
MIFAPNTAQRAAAFAPRDSVRPRSIVRVALLLRDPELSMRLGVQLVRAGMSVEMRSADPVEAEAAHHTADVIVFDLDLVADANVEIPAGRQGSSRRTRVPTIAVALRREEGVIARALAAGADDCIAAPIDEREFVMRVRAVMQRSWSGRSVARRLDPVERFGDIEIDVDARAVRRSGQAVTLQPKELDLLLALLARRGAAATRLELMAELGARRLNPSSRVLDTLVCRLRAELEEDPSTPRHLLTVPRYGYRLAAEG